MKQQNWTGLFILVASVFLISIVIRNYVLSLASIIFLFLSILIIQLWTGYAFNKGFEPNISRSERPADYWILVVINVFLLLFFSIALFKAID